jgi:hypothetical protein
MNAHPTREPSQMPGLSMGRRLVVPNPLAVLSIIGSQLKEGDFHLSLVSLTVANFRMADPGS